MRYGACLIILWVLFMPPRDLQADLYIWVDADGVKHVSNHPPPDRVDGVDRMPEQPYDAAADLKRRDREHREALKRRSINDRSRPQQPSGGGVSAVSDNAGETPSVSNGARGDSDDGGRSKKSWAKRQRIKEAREKLNAK